METSKEAKDKAVKLVKKFEASIWEQSMDGDSVILYNAKQCAIICVENEYNSLREQLFNLRACRVIESAEVYLKRVQDLIDEEAQVKHEIQQL